MPKPLHILDIDVECLPGHWIAADYVSKIITAVAWKWIDEGDPVTVLTHYDREPADMAGMLAAVIERADVVAGHFIRGFDLPLLNGNLLRAGQGPLSPVLAHDTKLDLTKTHGRSLSQRNLAMQLGVSKPKIDVTLPEWEAFNTRAPGARDKGIERVAGDVLQNIDMRKRLIEMDWLGAPKRWDGSPKGSGRYHA
jgi:hypothetical protein